MRRLVNLYIYIVLMLCSGIFYYYIIINYYVNVLLTIINTVNDTL